MTTEEWFEKATAYFNGAMSNEETQLFEMETAADHELYQLMQLWRNTDAEGALYAQHKEGADAFIATHQKLKEAFFNEDQAGKFFSLATAAEGRGLKFSVWKWIAAAAVITGIVFMIKLLIPAPKNNISLAQHKTEEDSAKHIAAPDTAITLADENKRKEKSPAQATQDNIQPAVLYAQAFVADDIPENPNGPLDDAFFYYASAQYKNAINAIDSAGSKALTRGNDAFTPLTNFYVHYYRGLSMMMLGNTNDAVPVLQQAVLQSPAEALKAKAQWYLALAYLKQEKISSAVSILRSLLNNADAGTYKSKAEKLLAALNK